MAFWRLAPVIFAKEAGIELTYVSYRGSTQAHPDLMAVDATGHRVQFATASQWVDRLAEAHHAGTLQDELRRLVRYPVLVIDEVGYIPFEPEAANLFFQLVSSRYERASLIVTSNKNFARWGEVFGDDTVAAAMIDRLVHHAEVIALKGDSYRLKDRDLGRAGRLQLRDQSIDPTLVDHGLDGEPAVGQGRDGGRLHRRHAGRY